MNTLHLRSLQLKNKSRIEVLECQISGRQNTLSTIYEIFSEAVNRCCGKRYANWMENLPQKFEIKIMELIDPCTFWLHVNDWVSIQLCRFQKIFSLLHYLCDI